MLYTLLRTAVTGVSLGVLALSCSDLLAGQEDSGENRGTLQWNFASAPLIEAMTRGRGDSRHERFPADRPGRVREDAL